MEHPTLEWIARLNYLAAKYEAKRFDVYGMDLLWKIVKTKYEGDIPMPSEVFENKNKVDRRSAKQIIDDTLSKFGGE